MANKEELEIIRQGARAWNKWREDNLYEEADLSEADLSKEVLSNANLSKTNLSGANLSESFLNRAYFSESNLLEANLSEANLSEANLSEAILRKAILRKAILNEADFSESDLSKTNLSEAYLIGAKLYGANLNGANLSGANLNGANLYGAKLYGANLSKADLSGANLSGTNLRRANLHRALLDKAILVETDLIETDLTNCSVYGIACWNVKLDKARQKDLIITPSEQSIITVDNLEVAQFVYLLLHNEKIRDVIDTITSKVVLILGRFSPERKAILDAIREELRNRDYLPVLFDFEGPSSRDITETVSTLAHMARFVIADITDARSIPQELHAIVPHLPSVPVQPLIQNGKDEYGLFEHFKSFPWVLAVHKYRDSDDLLSTLKGKVIAPPEKKVKELRGE